MNWFNFLSLAGAIYCLVMSTYVYFKIGKHSIHRLYSLAIFSIGFWCIDSFFMNFVRPDGHALIVHKFLYIGAITSQVAVIGWARAVRDNIQKWENWVVNALIVLGGIAYGLNFTDAFIKGTSEGHFHFSYFIEPGGFYFVFIILLAGCSVFSSYLIFRKMCESQDRDRLQLLYILIGLVTMYGAGYVYFLYLYKFKIYPVADFFVIACNSILTYAIVRHQLLDIEVIIKKTLVFTGLLASVFAALILPTLLLQEYIFRSAGFSGKIVGLMVSGIIIILTMRRIETFLINTTDKYLFQKKYDYKELLKTFTSEVLTVLEMDKLIDLTTNKLKNIIKLDSCVVEMAGDKCKKYPIPTKGTAELAIPVEINNERIGMLLLGKKKSDDLYTQDDLDILLPLSKTLAIAISNAHLFEELGKAQAEAAQQEKMATIGTLAAGMAHEIRNPITTIRTFADYLPERYMENGFIDIFNRLIPKEIDRVENIAKALLEFSSTEGEGREEEFAIKETLQLVLSLLEPQYKFTEIKISLNGVGNCVICKKKNQLQEALFSIMKYMLSEAVKDAIISIDIIAGADRDLTILFRDKRMIISDSIIEDVFKPASKFQKTKRGFGFGLFIAKEMIEKNDGIFSISSTEKNGTEFRIDFKSAFVSVS